MKHNAVIICHTRVSHIIATELKKSAIKLMRTLKLPSAEVCITLCDDIEMKRLNRTYRNKNKTTDVLSFDQNFKLKNITVLGDIIISVPQTKKQAKLKKFTFKEELFLLLTHGLLHLIGYDHQTKKKEKVMFTLQNALLTQTLQSKPYAF